MKRKIILMSILVIWALSSSLIAFANEQIKWTTPANSSRGMNGQRLTYTCPSGGTISDKLWGTDIYTDDSSICTAAVHEGLISQRTGGTVTIEIRPGSKYYKGSYRNNVASKDYGPWQGSFIFVSGIKAENHHSVGTPITWTTQANLSRGMNRQRLTYICPASGTLSDKLWGTDLYTDDSSICTAAVHAGLISLSNGGPVTIEVRPGGDSYTGSFRNGATSKNYGPWEGSFIFVDGSKSSSTSPAITQITWATPANSSRGLNGQRLTYICPSRGNLSDKLWGTDLYTDDSSICSAAVHEGLISQKTGGTVTIEIRPGAKSYKGSYRNNVASKDYGPWQGSFIFVDSQ